MNTIKSIMTVNTNNSGWATRVRFADLSERFVIAGGEKNGLPLAKYSLAQAQMATQSLYRAISNHGDEMAIQNTQSLPAGVKVVKS